MNYFNSLRIGYNGGLNCINYKSYIFILDESVSLKERFAVRDEMENIHFMDK
jgi:hypothetical protein